MTRAGAVLAAFALLASPSAPADAAPFRLPEATRARLANGLQVVIVPSARLPLVDFRLVARSGSVDDPPGKEGLAALTAALMTQGAGGRDAHAVAEDMAFVGGSLECQAFSEQIVVTCEVLKKDFALGLAMFRDVIVTPTFAAAEFERKRDEALAAIVADRNDPATVADLALGPFLLGSSPLAHPVLGSESSLPTITREEVAAFHARRVKPDHALLAVVGDVDPQVVIASLERAFALWSKSGETWRDSYSPVLQAKGRRVSIVRKPDVTQSQIRLACVGVPRNHPDVHPILVANAILGSGFTSRLVDEVRVRQGLTYGIDSEWAMYRNAGAYSLETFTRNESIRKTIDASLATVRTLVDQGPTEEELARAKRVITGLYPLGLQAPDALAARLLDVDFYGLEPGAVQTFPDRIAAVTMTDVRRALKSYFCVDDLRILVVSDPVVARPQLEGLGPIDERDP